MADLIAPGVWWLHGTRGSNVFALDAGDRLLLIDTGFAASAPAVIAELERIAPGRRPDAILLTHRHPDHAGAAAALRAMYGCTVFAGAADCAVDSDGRSVLAEPRARARRVARRLLRRAVPPPVVVDRPLSGGVLVAPGALALPTPGHTPGSYCFLDSERGIAFVGDLVISHGQTIARPLAITNDDDARYLASLSAFAGDAPAIGCAGHGPPVLDGFGDSVRALATLPRRGLFSPRGLCDRIRYLRTFARGMSRRR